MTEYYSDAQCIGNSIYYRGIRNGVPIKEKVPFSPTLYVQSKKPEPEFHTIYGEALDSVSLGSIREARDFVKLYAGASNFPIYGNRRYEYQFLAETFPDEQIPWSSDDLQIANIDIEVGSENGFSEPDEALNPITAITIRYSKQQHSYVYGCGDFSLDAATYIDKTRKDITYIKCDDEIDLITKFLDQWKREAPNAVTGWFCKFYDIPYIVQRCKNVFGEDANETTAMSFWGSIRSANANFMNQQRPYIDLVGTPILDMIEMYRKFTQDGVKRESTKLGYIGYVELGLAKVDYVEEGSLHNLYRENYQKFIEYNIRDVDIVQGIDDKFKLLELVFTLAYNAKCNFDDTFAQVTMWDQIIHCHLLKKKIAVPVKIDHSKSEQYGGAYVKEPKPGLYEYIVTLDLNSLYPMMQIMMNISPDRIVAVKAGSLDHITIDGLINNEFDLGWLKEEKLALTPNKQLFDISSPGFLPEILERMYADRKRYKKMSMAAKAELQKLTKDTPEYKKKEFEVARYHNLQLTCKVGLNSCYGALGSEYSRYFDIRLAEAVTSGAQLAIRFMQDRMNRYLNMAMNTTDEDFVIASDTDSLYLNLGPAMKKYLAANPTPDVQKQIDILDKIVEKKLQPVIESNYRAMATYINAYKPMMEMKREALALKGIWRAKKNYLMLVYDLEGVRYTIPEVKVTGLESVRGSTPEICREKLKEAYKVILTGTESEYHKLVGDFEKYFASAPVHEVASPRGMNGLTDWAGDATIYRLGCPINVKGSLIFNHYLKKFNLDKKYAPIRDGDKIKFIYLKKSNPFQEGVIAFANVIPAEFDLDGCLDYNMQFEKTFKGPVESISLLAGWSFKKQSSLGI